MASGEHSSGKCLAVYKLKEEERAPPFRERTRLNVTIKMLMEAKKAPRDQGRLVINHSQVYMVQLCGMITSLDHSDSWTDYVLYDGTGSISGRVWSRDPEGWTDLSTATKGQYYFINGTLATRFEELKIDTLTASYEKTREVIDMNEITVHYLTVIHEHLHLKERYEKIQTPSSTFSKARTEMDKEAILSLLTAPAYRDDEGGATEQQIRDALGIDESGVKEALDGLINDGLVYNTTDDKHYRLADN